MEIISSVGAGPDAEGFDASELRVSPPDADGNRFIRTVGRDGSERAPWREPAGRCAPGGA